MTKAKKKQTATTNSYSSQYKNPKWQKKRLEILERDNFACRKCGDKESTLHVHHFEYTKGRKVWEYNDSNFATLCDSCHAEIHSLNDRIKYDIVHFNRNWVKEEHGEVLGSLADLVMMLAVCGGGEGARIIQASVLLADRMVDIARSIHDEYNTEEG